MMHKPLIMHLMIYTLFFRSSKMLSFYLEFLLLSECQIIIIFFSATWLHKNTLLFFIKRIMCLFIFINKLRLLNAHYYLHIVFLTCQNFWNLFFNWLKIPIVILLFLTFFLNGIITTLCNKFHIYCWFN